MLKKSLRLVAALAVGMGASFSLMANDNFPSKPIKLVVPYSPGGGTDGVARRLAQEMRTELGQPVVVENRPGAGATIGHDFVAKSAPDGYTLIVSANTLAIFKTLYPSLPFDSVAAFAPVATVANSPMVLVAGKDLPNANLESVIQSAKSNPGKFNFGTAGAGTPMHLAGEMLKIRAKVTMEHVAYRGSGPAIADVLAGHVAYGIFGLSSTLNLIREGRLKGYGIFDAQRSPLDPSLPTLAEAGLKGAEAPLIYTILAPVGTPDPVVRKLSAAFKNILSNPAIQPALAAQGFVPQYGTPEQTAALYKEEEVRWRDVIKATKLALE